MLGRIRGGIVVGVAVLLAAVVYSVVYFSHGGANFGGGVLNIILVLLWACIVVVLLVVLWHRAQVREEYMCKFYLSNGMLFNFVLGAVPVESALASNDSAGLAKYLQDAVGRLTFENAPLAPPANFAPTYCVSFGRNASSGNCRGSLQRIQQREDGHRTYVGVAAFQNSSELQQALEEHGVLD